MARFYPSGGTGGADVSVVTAMKENVEKGKVIVGPDGEPITGELELTGTAADSQVLAGQTYYNTDLHEKRTGAMANQGAWKSEGLAAGAEVAIPPGYHNGGGKVVAKDLASQTPGNLTPSKMLAGTYGYSNGVRVDGIISNQGALTLNPGLTPKTGNVSGKYMIGNISVPAVSVPANVLKKGYVQRFPDGSSVTGQFQGYVPDYTDLYIRGNNRANFVPTNNNAIKGAIIFDGEKISFGKQINTSVSGSLGSWIAFINTRNPFDFTNFTRLNVEGYCTYYNSNSNLHSRLYITTGPYDDWNEPGTYLAKTEKTDFVQAQSFTYSLDITNINTSAYVTLKFGGFTGKIVSAYVYRIWVS